MNNDLTIRKATAEDIPLIRELVFKIWPQTYAAILSQEQIDYMLEMMYSEASLQKQISNGSRFIIVYEKDNPIGYAAYFSKSPSVFKLDKIYVLLSLQGRGIGRYIIDYVITEIKARGATALQLQVNRGNKARDFYEKLGFVVIDQKDFDIGSGFVMDDYVMELKIS